MDATITRDDSTLGGSATYTFDFTTSNPFPSGGEIILYMPTDQIVLDTTQT